MMTSKTSNPCIVEGDVVPSYGDAYVHTVQYAQD